MHHYLIPLFLAPLEEEVNEERKIIIVIEFIV